MVDVCLILEGTYPYLTGGVSAWVQTLLTGLPDLTFGLIHLSAGRQHPAPMRYAPPPNLMEFVEWSLDLEMAGLWQRGGNDECRPVFPPPQTSLHPCIAAPLPQARVYHALSTGFAGLLGCQIKAATQRPLILTEHAIYWREVQAGANELECGFRVVPTGQHGLDLRPLRHHWTIAL